MFCFQHHLFHFLKQKRLHILILFFKIDLAQCLLEMTCLNDSGKMFPLYRSKLYEWKD